jgi:Tol biopolymer transport system component
MSVEQQLAAYFEVQDELHPAITPNEIGGSALRVAVPVKRATTVWWIGAVAAAVTILVIGGIGILVGHGPLGDDANGTLGEPSTTAAPSTTYAIGRHSVDVDGVSLSFEIPEVGWESAGDFLMSKDGWPEADIAVIFFATFPDGADIHLCTDLAPGELPGTSGIDRVAESFASVIPDPNIRVVDYVVGGLPAKFFQAQVRDAVGCDPGFFYSWDPGLGGAAWTESKLGDVINAWFVDLDDKVLVIMAETRWLPIDANSEIFPIVDSIRFPAHTPTATGDHVMDLDTGEVTLLPEAIRISHPSRYAASPDASTLAYLAPDIDGSFQLFIAAIDGADMRQITHPPGDAGWPAWSPDGSKVAYVQSGDLFVLDVATGESTRLPDVSADCCVQFTPDGSSILYTGGGGSSSGLWLVSVDGAENTPFIGEDQGVDAAVGSISPDGSLVTFMGSRIGGPGALRFIAETDHPQPQEFGRLDFATCAGGNPSGTWSPAGDRIVCAGQDGVIVTVDAATAETTQVAEGNGAIWLDDHTLLIEAWGK